MHIHLDERIEGKRLLAEIPKDGTPVRLVFWDDVGEWISPALYAWNGKVWMAESGVAARSSLVIAGWLPAPGPEAL